MSDEVPKQFPHYPPGIPVATGKDAGMLAKMLSRGLKAKGKSTGGKKGLVRSSAIHIGKRKQKFY
jgi:hypothetical protein